MREHSPCNLVSLVRALSLFRPNKYISDALIVVVNTYTSLFQTSLQRSRRFEPAYQLFGKSALLPLRMSLNPRRDRTWCSKLKVEDGHADSLYSRQQALKSNTVHKVYKKNWFLVLHLDRKIIRVTVQSGPFIGQRIILGGCKREKKQVRTGWHKNMTDMRYSDFRLQKPRG